MNLTHSDVDIVCAGVAYNTDKLIAGLFGMSVGAAKRLRLQHAVEIDGCLIPDVEYWPTIAEMQQPVVVRAGKKFVRMAWNEETTKN